DRPRAPPRHPRRPGSPPFAEGVRAAAPPRDPCRQGGHPPPAAARDLGAGAGGRGAVPARLHPRAQAETGARPDAADPYPHGARGRVQVAAAAGAAVAVGGIYASVQVKAIRGGEGRPRSISPALRSWIEEFRAETPPPPAR